MTNERQPPGIDMTKHALSITPTNWLSLPTVKSRQELVVFLITLLLAVLFAAVLPGFATIGNFLALLRSISVLGILGLAASNFFYYFAIEKTTVATAIVLQYVAPVWVLLYMLSRRLQRPTGQRVMGVVLAVIGCGIAVRVVATRSTFPWLGFSGARFSTMGVIAAELAAISFAFYNVYAQHLVQKYDRWTVLLYALLGAAVFWQFVNPPWKIGAQHYSAPQWLFLLVFAVASMLVPFSFYFAGLQHLDPTRAVVTACLEPVWAIALTALLLGEFVSSMQIVGIVLVLIATMLVQRPDRAATREPIIAVEPIE